jgi:hypothetical protein
VWGLVSVDQIGGTLNRTVKGSAQQISAFFASSKSPFLLASPSGVSNTTTGATGSNPTPKNGAKASGSLSTTVFAFFFAFSIL